MGYVADCLNTFNSLPKEVLDRIGSFEMVEKIQAIEKEYGVDLKFLVILITINELTMDDIPEYLEKDQGADPEVAQQVMMELVDKVFVVFFDSPIQKQILTIDGLKEIFAGNILGLLESDAEIKEEFNLKVGHLLFGGDPREDKFTQTESPAEIDEFAVEKIQLEFVGLLEKNNEQLGDQPISLAGREVLPTIANWLKAYQRYQETGFGESIALSKFLTVSENGKNLTAANREKLRSVLVLYRNVQFFPDSMLDIPVADWQFVPVRTGEDEAPVAAADGQIQAARPRLAVDYNFAEVFDPWLQSGHYQERWAFISRKHALTDQQQAICQRITQDLFKEKIRLNDLFTQLQQGLALNREEAGLLSRDIIGYLLKPVAQYLSGYRPELLEEFGGREEDFPDPGNIMTILNQIAIVKNAKQQKQQKQAEAEVKSQADKKAAAQAAGEIPQLAQELEKKLKDFYQQVKTREIKQAEQRFAGLYQDQSEFIKQFYQAINDRNRDKVLGALGVLAQQGKLLDILADDKKIQSLYDKYLTKKYGVEVAQDFAEHPTRPAYLSYFLQHLLIDTLKMSGNDSAALASHLFNEQQKAAGQEAEMPTYGDLETQEFKWRKIISQDNKLIMEKD